MLKKEKLRMMQRSQLMERLMLVFFVFDSSCSNIWHFLVHFQLLLHDKYDSACFNAINVF